jgi:hypothetical protein
MSGLVEGCGDGARRGERRWVITVAQKSAGELYDHPSM